MGGLNGIVGKARETTRPRGSGGDSEGPSDHGPVELQLNGPTDMFMGLWVS